MPIKWKSKILLAKTETSYGVDPTLTGAANALLLTNVQLSPMEGEDVDHEEELPYLGNSRTSATGLRMRLRASVNLHASGTPGVAPAWGPVMKGLGCSETVVGSTSVTYRPVSDGHDSLYWKVWIGSTLYAMKGSRGDGTIRFPAQGLPKLEIDFQGLFIKPEEATRPTPTLTNWKRAKVVSALNTPSFAIDEVPLVMREVSMALGNDVQPRLLVPTEQIVIVDRGETISARVEAVPLTTFDPYAAALDDGDLVPLTLTHGTAAGHRMTLSAGTCQQQRLSGLENQQNVKEWPLSLKPQPGSGNDQWSLTLT